MAWLRRNKPYDRARCVAQAVQARKKGNHAKALALYQEVLAHEPNSADIHRRTAPLLAAAKRSDEAWEAYRIATTSLERAGFLDQAVGVLREATGCLADRRGAWEALAEAELERARPADAVEALLEGRRRFRGREGRPDAIRLLLRARRLAPTHFALNFDLADLLARSGAREPAARILAELAQQAEGRALRRTRRRQLVLSPSPAALWRWLRSWSGRR